MIAHRDFQPEVQGLFPDARRTRENFERAVAEANEWIGRESVDVVNVETLDVDDIAFATRSVRVWYRTSVNKPPRSLDD